MGLWYNDATEVIELADEFELAVIEQVEPKTYRPPAYLDEQNISADTFIINFAKFLPMYIAKNRPAADTMSTYETAIRLFFKWCNENNMHPLAVRDFQMRLYIQHLENNQKLSSSTVRLKMEAIRAFYNMATKMNFIKTNPCDDIPLPTIKVASDEDFKYYTLEQLGEICDTFLVQEPATCARNTLIVYLMGVEGLRRVEVMRLNDEDIDYERKRILIRGKGHNGFIYPCDATMDRLMDYLHLRGPVEPDNGVTPTIISFSNRRYGKRITRTGLHVIISKALEFAGVKYPGHACHTLRHSCGTNLYHETKDLRVVQETLRHSSPEMTARYSHVAERSSTRPTRNIIPISKGDVGVRDGGV